MKDIVAAIEASIEELKVNPHPEEGMHRSIDVEMNRLLDRVAEAVRKNFYPTIETGDGDSHWYACPHCKKPIDMHGMCGERIAELEAGIHELVEFMKGEMLSSFLFDYEKMDELIDKYEVKS